MTERVLYISYDGMLEPLGQSQVLGYLEKLAPGREIHLISFEKADDWSDRKRRQVVRDRIAAAGIRWHPLRYHKRPTAPATAYDIAQGSAVAIAIAIRHGIRIVHARSYVAGVMGLAVKRATGARFLFDMRGFWADERVDGNLWPANGRLYRSAKDIERRVLLAADHVVTLTHASESEIARFPYLQGRLPPITVIPTCANLDRFTIQGPLQQEPFILGHIGAVGTWYLLDEMMRCFGEVKAQLPDAKLLIANRGEHEAIRAKVAEHGIDRGDLELLAVEHRDVPAVIGRMSAGMAIIKPAYSKIASAPTKLAEYLGCGIPCLGNAGVGDVEGVLEDRRVGVAIKEFNPEALRAAIGRLVELTRDPRIGQRCRETALDLFSLGGGVEAYDRIYRELSA